MLHDHAPPFFHFLLPVFFAPFFCAGQTGTALPGYVTLQTSGGKSADPATVQAGGATATTVRAGDGFFRLVFDEKRPGQDVELSVEKPGYEVVNRESLLARLPDTAAGEPPLRIFLCPQGQWRRQADQYYETNQRVVADRYERRIRSAQQRLSTANTANSALADTLARLTSERDATLELLKGYAEQLARTNLDDVTARYRTAFRLFTLGKMDSFLLVIREKDIRDDLARVESEIARARALGKTGRDKIATGQELRRQTLQELLIRARALALAGQWDDADRTFRMVFQEDSTNREILGEYYQFKRNRLHGQEALHLAGRLLALPGTTTADSAKWWNEIGRNYALLHDKDRALTHYQQSAALYKTLTKRFPTLLMNYAEVLGNMAGIHWSKGDYDEAQRLNEESLSLLERCARTLKFAGPMVPSRMIDIGDQYMRHYDYAHAEATFLRAGELMRKVADTTSREYKEWTVRQKMALVNVYQNTDRPEQSIMLLDKLLEQSAIDARRDPDRYLWEHITINACLGNALVLQFRWVEAKHYLTLADSLLAQSEKPLTAYLELIKAQIVTGLGSVSFYQNNMQEAEQYFQKGLALYRPIYQRDSLTYGDHLVMVYEGLFMVYQYSGSAATERFLSEYEVLLRGLAGMQAQKYRLPLANLLQKAGAYYLQSGDAGKAGSSLREAEQIYLSNPGQNPFDFANCQAALGRLALEQSDFNTAARYLDAARITMENLLPRRTARLMEEALANVLLDQGRLYAATEPVRAEECLQAAVAIKRKTAAAMNTAPLKGEIAYGLRLLGTLKSSYGQQDQAVELLEESLVFYQAQAAGQPNVPRVFADQSIVLSLLGNVYLMKNQPGKALEKHQAAQRLMQTAARLAPDPEPYLKAAMLPQLDLSVTYLALNDSVQAEIHLHQCQALFENAEDAPDDFKIRLAFTANRFGNFYETRKNSRKARAYYLRAAALYKAITRLLPPAHAQAVFNALQIALVDLQIYKDTKNKDFRDEARDQLKIAEKMADDLPDNFFMRADLMREIESLRTRMK